MKILMMRALLLSALVCIGCGGDIPMRAVTPTPVPTPVPTPTPAPAPPRVTITGRVTVTQSGAPIPNATIAIDGRASILADGAGAFSLEDAPASTVHAVISAPGYVTRDTRIGSGHVATIDLIAMAPPFSSIFYGQLVRGVLDYGTPDIVRTLPAAPSFYLQTSVISGGTTNRFVAAIREIVPAMTGGRFTAQAIETGAEARPEQAGWIVIEVDPNPEHLLVDGRQACGQAYVGRVSGHVWLTSGLPNGCGLGSDPIAPVILQHEIGHALGFWHIDVLGSLMHPGGPGSYQIQNTRASDLEQYHAAIAYRRQSGNRDPDIDASTAAPLSVRPSIIVVD